MHVMFCCLVVRILSYCLWFLVRAMHAIYVQVTDGIVFGVIDVLQWLFDRLASAISSSSFSLQHIPGIRKPPGNTLISHS